LAVFLSFLHSFMCSSFFMFFFLFSFHIFLLFPCVFIALFLCARFAVLMEMTVNSAVWYGILFYTCFGVTSASILKGDEKAEQRNKYCLLLAWPIRRPWKLSQFFAPERL
jgi:hypothetical protein